MVTRSRNPRKRFEDVSNAMIFDYNNAIDIIYDDELLEKFSMHLWNDKPSLRSLISQDVERNKKKYIAAFTKLKDASNAIEIADDKKEKKRKRTINKLLEKKVTYFESREAFDFNYDSIPSISEKRKFLREILKLIKHQHHVTYKIDTDIHGDGIIKSMEEEVVRLCGRLNLWTDSSLVI